MASNSDAISNTASAAYYAKVQTKMHKGENTATAVYILLEVVQVTFLSDEVGDVDRNVEYAVIGIP